MRRRAVLLITTIAAALVAATGVALAADIRCEAGAPCLGTNKADTMTGTSQADTMKGRDGGDTMYGRGGGDDLDGDDGIDEIYAGQGNDELDGGPNPNTLTPEEKLSGGDGDDSYVFEEGWGDDKITDGESSGADTLVFSSSVKRLNADLDTSDGRGEVYADGGLLYVYGAVIEDVKGGENRDVVRGNDAPNRFVGKGGNDSLYGRAGNDGLLGGPGADALNGGPDNDVLNGSGVIDVTDAIDGDVYLFQDGWGNDSVTDAAGIDRLYFGELTNSSVTVDLAAGTATAGTSTVTWLRQAIENATGGQVGDFLYGDDLGNTLDGQGGNDTMEGRGGDDTMYGRNGSDTMYGGPGLDKVYGDHPSISTETGDDEIHVEGDTGIIVGDTVYCGPGSDDVVFYDVDIDTIADDCEWLNRRPPQD